MKIESAPASTSMTRRRFVQGGLAASVLPAQLHGQPLPADVSEVARGLAFPEGLFTFADGSLGCVEIAGGTLTRIHDGKATVVARTGPGPNGAALLPDGSIVICDNGGLAFERDRGVYRIAGLPSDDVTGSIVRVDPGTGSICTMYRHTAALPLNGPNDCVWDGGEGFWFTDTGKNRRAGRDPGALFWAAIDGSRLVKVLDGLDSPNGIVINPDDRVLTVALSASRRLLRARIAGPGALGQTELTPAVPGNFLFDNIVHEANGNLLVGCVKRGGILTVNPDGVPIGFLPLPDFAVTALCFGGTDNKTLFAALSTTGRIVSIAWPRRGLNRAAIRKAL